MLRLNISERLADRVDRACGDPRIFQLLEPRGCRLLSNRLAYQTDHFIPIGDAGAVRGEALVARPFGMAADRREAGELPVVSDGDDDRLIGRIEWLVWHDIGV